MRKIMIIEGILGRDEAAALFSLASETKEGCIVEVGSYRGKSTVALATGSQHGYDVPVYAIDPHETFVGAVGAKFGPADRSAFFANMLRTGCSESVRLINLPSQIVARTWEQSIGLLWLDGDHSYEAVASDFLGFSPFVIRGGHIAFHDSLDHNLGPARVIAEALDSQEYEKIAQVELTTIIRRAT